MTALHDHSEYQAFLAAIRATPDDDLPRLAFADWLEEHGQAERAEWIRYMIPHDPATMELTYANRKSLTANGSRGRNP